MSKYKIGVEYVVKLKDERSVEMLREVTKRESIAFHIGTYTINTLKAVAILCSVICPPLLLVTLPLMRRKDVVRKS